MAKQTAMRFELEDVAILAPLISRELEQAGGALNMALNPPPDETVVERNTRLQAENAANLRFDRLYDLQQRFWKAKRRLTS